MSAVADRAYAQRLRALAMSNEVRSRRRVFKQRLRSGDVALADVIREPEWFVLSCPVHEVLGWAPRVGRDRVNRVLRRAEVWPLRTVGALTPNQKRRVILELSAVMGAGR